MVWNFNFCSPHLNDDQTVNLNRTLMVVEVVIAMLVTFVLHMLAELYDQDSTKVKNQANLPQDQQKQEEDSASEIHKNMETVSMKSKAFGMTIRPDIKETATKQAGFFRGRKVFFLTVQNVENRAPCFMGHFTIAIAACAMYSPFYIQTIMGLVYLIDVCLLLVFFAWQYERLTILTVAVSYLLNLGLVASALVGVGLANWDPFGMTCYYTKMGM